MNDELNFCNSQTCTIDISKKKCLPQLNMPSNAGRENFCFSNVSNIEIKRKKPRENDV